MGIAIEGGALTAEEEPSERGRRRRRKDDSGDQDKMDPCCPSADGYAGYRNRDQIEKSIAQKRRQRNEVHQQLPTPHSKFTDGNILAIQGLWIPGRDGVLLPTNSHVGGERLVVKGEDYFRTKKSSNFFRNDITSFDYGSSIRTLVRSPSSQCREIFKVAS